VAALVENLEEQRIPEQSRELDFTPWGGAYNRVPAEATAFAHRDGHFLLLHAAVVDPDALSAEREAARSWLGRSWATAHPWGSGGVYPNFPDLEGWPRAYHGENLERLVRVKGRYDPEGFFRFHHSLSPAQSREEAHTPEGPLSHFPSPLSIRIRGRVFSELPQYGVLGGSLPLRSTPILFQRVT
jgi:hypothetical protein